MNCDRQIEQALHVIPTHRETHGIKGTFAVRRLSLAFPHWEESILPGALELAKKM